MAPVCAVGGWLSRLDRGRPRSGGTALTATTHRFATVEAEEDIGAMRS